jgi:hypothetical protein
MIAILIDLLNVRFKAPVNIDPCISEIIFMRVFKIYVCDVCNNYQNDLILEPYRINVICRHDSSFINVLYSLISLRGTRKHKMPGHFHTRVNVSILPVNPEDSENLVENYQTKIIDNTTHNN